MSSSLSSSESEDEEPVEFLASTRSRRGNAGAKMAKLLNEEEEDDFYKTTYGGFIEVCLIYNRQPCGILILVCS